MPSTRTTLALVAGAVCVVILAWVWWSIHTGYIIPPWERREAVLCDGRVQREFPRFWNSVGGRELLPREGYSISTRHVVGSRRIGISLQHCRSGRGQRLKCRVAKTVEAAGLRQGDEYLLDPAAVTNWTYYRNFKFYHGCNFVSLLSTNFSRFHCEKVARETFVDFAYAVETKNIDPHKQWVDVQLTPNESGRIWGRLEARLNRCRRRETGEFVCRIDSASPESGLAIDDWHVVKTEDVLSWMYTIERRQIRSCDGEEVKQFRWPPDLRDKLPTPGGTDAKQ